MDLPGDAELSKTLPDATAFKTHMENFTYRSPGKVELEVSRSESDPSTMTPRRAPFRQNSVASTRSSSKRPSPAPTNLKTSPNTDESSTRFKRRRSAKERSANDDPDPCNKLVDSLTPGLILVLIGLNPGLQTAETGHAYAHPTNFYWPFLYESGITPILHKPSDTHSLPRLYRIGNTNQCVRPTRDGSGLTKQEKRDGVPILETKIALFKPEAVAIVGKGIWEDIYGVKTGKKCTRDVFHYGWQDEELWLGRQVDEKGEVLWKGSRTYVATTTSALAAAMSREEKLAIWKPLGEWVKKRREESEKEEEGGQAATANDSTTASAN